MLICVRRQRLLYLCKLVGGGSHRAQVVGLRGGVLFQRREPHACTFAHTSKFVFQAISSGLAVLKKTNFEWGWQRSRWNGAAVCHLSKRNQQQAGYYKCK